MAKWVLLDAEGNVSALVLSDVEPSQSTGHDVSGLTIHEVSEFKPLDCYTYNNGWQLNLPIVRARAVVKVNENREKLQSDYLTKGDAKSYIYAQKAAEVEKSKQDESLDPADYPFAQAEATLTGKTLQQVLDLFEQGRASVIAACALIEAKAQLAIDQINASNSIEQIQELRDTFLGED
jgi:hypothetical protein